MKLMLVLLAFALLIICNSSNAQQTIMDNNETDLPPTTTHQTIDNTNELLRSTESPIIESTSTQSAAPTVAAEISRIGESNDVGSTCSSCAAIDEDMMKPVSNPCELGSCVPYYLCLNGSIITSGEGILDVRIGSEDDPEPAKHPCPDFFDTCCSLKSDEIVKEVVKPKIETHEKCGIRNKKGAAFTLIERENEAQFAEFPWVVAIILKVHDNEDVVNLYKCGASLIHPSVVMTAAHCVNDLRNMSHDLMIRAGEWDTQTINEPFPHQDRKVVEVLIHEHYKRGPHFNNIALLFLDKPIDLAENINTVCLPPQDFHFDNQRCFATGWGKDKFGKDGLYQVILKKVELPVVPSLDCQKILRETRLGKHFILDSSFICAGGESGHDTCQGDGGSPLNCEVPNSEFGQYYLGGEVAWGIGCFDPIPGVYVNVAKFRSWVDHVFNERKLDPKHYTAF